jgi:hypothetical protein
MRVPEFFFTKKNRVVSVSVPVRVRVRVRVCVYIYIYILAVLCHYFHSLKNLPTRVSRFECHTCRKLIVISMRL